LTANAAAVLCDKDDFKEFSFETVTNGKDNFSTNS
jgi:hypothetical protein